MPSVNLHAGSKSARAVRDAPCARLCAQQHPHRVKSHGRCTEAVLVRAQSLEASPSQLNGAHGSAAAGTMEPVALQTSPDAILTTFTFPQALSGEEIVLVGASRACLVPATPLCVLLHTAAHSSALAVCAVVRLFDGLDWACVRARHSCTLCDHLRCSRFVANVICRTIRKLTCVLAVRQMSALHVTGASVGCRDLHGLVTHNHAAQSR